MTVSNLLARCARYVFSGGDFRGPVSESKNSVPGGQGSAADICFFVHGGQTSAAARQSPAAKIPFETRIGQADRSSIKSPCDKAAGDASLVVS
jgi:hypothetical protein